MGMAMAISMGTAISMGMVEEMGMGIGKPEEGEDAIDPLITRRYRCQQAEDP